MREGERSSDGTYFEREKEREERDRDTEERWTGVERGKKEERIKERGMDSRDRKPLRCR